MVRLIADMAKIMTDASAAFSCGRRGTAVAVDEESVQAPPPAKCFSNSSTENSNVSIRQKTGWKCAALRKKMTPEEKHIWYDFLKMLPVTVKRQKNIENYILDFYIASAKIAIEIDGLQHALPQNKAADLERDSTLARWGITVLRYTNKDINERFYAVCEEILNAIGLIAVDLNV